MLIRRVVSIFGWVLMAAVVAPSCEGTTYTCDGVPYECRNLKEEVCVDAPGCILKDGPSCEFSAHGCSGADVSLTTSCLPPTCVVANGRCESVCVTFTDEASCVGAQWLCTWAGDRCTTACNLLTTRDACHAGTNCFWSACLGNVAVSCATYSDVACPIKLGCTLKPHYTYSTQ